MFIAPRLGRRPSWPMVGASDRRVFEPGLLPVYTLIAIAAAIVAVAVASGRFTADPALFGGRLRDMLPVLVLAYVLRWSGLPRLAGLVELIALSALFAAISIFCSVVFAAAALPRVDGILVRADALLFAFDRRELAALVAPHAAFLRAMTWVYHSVALTWNVLILLLFVTGRCRQAWVVVTALMLAPAIAIAISPLVPAYGTPPYAYSFADVFDGVRAGTIRRLDASVMTGIVTFPSLHAAGGVLLAWGFAGLGRWAWPLVGLNLLVIVSAVVVGGHYLVDIVAGLALAWLSARLARRWVNAVVAA